MNSDLLKQYLEDDLRHLRGLAADLQYLGRAVRPNGPTGYKDTVSDRLPPGTRGEQVAAIGDDIKRAVRRISALYGVEL